MSTASRPPKHFAIVGAGMAAITCARTLVQAGHQVTVFEKSRGVGGRMATRDSAFGSFDHGAQYFTARDPRFLQALQTTPDLCKRWSANSVQVLDELGRATGPARPDPDAHWVAVPGMKSLVAGWAEPLKAAGCLVLQTRVTHIEPDAVNAGHWQLRTEEKLGSDANFARPGAALRGAPQRGAANLDSEPNFSLHVFPSFDGVLLAIPSAQARELLQTSKLSETWIKQIDAVQVAPCWTLMLAFPQAMQPGLTTLGPQWNAARSTHHRIAWAARESSKPARSPIERWTVQASPAWSQEHLHDDPARAEAKLLKAFTEVTGIRAEPALVDSQRWLYAKTLQPLGQSHLWDAKKGLGVCGDWCLGHRVEDAFVSGLELALAAV